LGNTSTQKCRLTKALVEPLRSCSHSFPHTHTPHKRRPRPTQRNVGSRKNVGEWGGSRGRKGVRIYAANGSVTQHGLTRPCTSTTLCLAGLRTHEKGTRSGARTHAKAASGAAGGRRALLWHGTWRATHRPTKWISDVTHPHFPTQPCKQIHTGVAKRPAPARVMTRLTSDRRAAEPAFSSERKRWPANRRADQM